MVVSVTFELTVREKSDLSIWLDITEHKNFIFLRQLQPYLSKISQHGTHRPICSEFQNSLRDQVLSELCGH